MADQFGLSSRQVWTIFGVLFGIIGGVAGVAVLSVITHLDVVMLALVFVGAYVAGGALLRPWWFWDVGKAVALREALGDRAALVLYLLIGIGFAGLGVYRGIGLHEARAACQEALAQAQVAAPHSRVSALLRRQAVPLQNSTRCSDLLASQ